MEGTMTELEAIGQEIASCQLCELAKTRNLTVPGEGNPNADILFVGEAPGWHENQQGRPFVGAAGQFLEQLLQSISLSREDVFIANVVKCRPPQNRDPLPEEIAACSGFLNRQLATIKPKLVVTLGRFSLGRFFPVGKGIGALHGTTCMKNGQLCFAMYHPAAALHQPSLKRTLEQDMLKIPEVLAVATSVAEPAKPADPTVAENPSQLSLF
jgi:uracil-DNA glycosylase